MPVWILAVIALVVWNTMRLRKLKWLQALSVVSHVQGVVYCDSFLEQNARRAVLPNLAQRFPVLPQLLLDPSFALLAQNRREPHRGFERCVASVQSAPT
uniref:Putative secreted protein n=1 Tax=Ixodes ricinus TaxID=34613 RepID=A0A6B0U5E6_IXORI